MFGRAVTVAGVDEVGGVGPEGEVIPAPPHPEPNTAMASAESSVLCRFTGRIVAHGAAPFLTA